MFFCKSFIFRSATKYINGMFTGKGNKNCTDPKILYERSVRTVDSLINLVKIWPKSGSSFVIKGTDFQNWEFTYNWLYGRCFTLKIPLRYKDKGVSIMSIKPANHSIYVFAHSPNNFQMTKQSDWTRIIAERKKKVSARVIYEIFDMLDYNNKECNASDNYKFDLCRAEESYKVTKSICKLIGKINFSIVEVQLTPQE